MLATTTVDPSDLLAAGEDAVLRARVGYADDDGSALAGLTGAMVAQAFAEHGTSASLEEIARQRGGRGIVAVARLTRARVFGAMGRSDDALVALAQARAGFLASGQRYEAARAVRLEARLRGSLPEAWRALDVLVRVDGDA